MRVLTPYQIKRHERARLTRKKRAAYARKERLVLADPDLSVKSDAVVCIKYNENSSFICRIRNKHNIPSYREKCSDEKRAKILAFGKLGEWSDTRVGKKFETTAGVVRHIRVNAGIAAHNHRNKNRAKLASAERYMEKVNNPEWRNVLLQTWKPKTDWEKCRQWIRGYVGISANR